MSNFDRALGVVLRLEGGYVNDPRDPGGVTNLGITIATLQSWRGPGITVTPNDVRALTAAEAGQIYQVRYWAPVRANDLPWGLALVTFDAAVNQGVGAARTMLQTAVGVTADGTIGERTLAAVRQRDAHTLIREMCAQRALRYAHSDMATYGLGWMRRLFEVALLAVQPIPTA
jgi:lysozyme family protein